jgi:predicted Zn-dependent protease with MMP-like domain
MQELVSEIRITLVHEIAHFYGLDEARIHELGWG